MAKIPTLETGYRVETRNGNRYIVMAYENTWVLIRGEGLFMRKHNYNNTLKCLKDWYCDNTSKNFDIMKIYDRPADGILLEYDAFGFLLWQRNETELTAKEAIVLRDKMCSTFSCNRCPLCELDDCCFGVANKDLDKLLSLIQSYKEEHEDV